MRKHLRDKRPILVLGVLAAVSVLWLVVKTGRKPSRIAYPCQRAAVANIHVFLVALLPSLDAIRRVGWDSRHWLEHRAVKAGLLLGCLLLALSVPFPSDSLLSTRGQFANIAESIPLDLTPQNAFTSANSSTLFFVQNASGTNGNCDAAFSTLISLMATQGLHFFKTPTQPDGLIARGDVVLIKVNAVGPERSGTNTDLVKSLITMIVNHPEGFSGEVVLADNGQDTGGLDLAEHNAVDYSQSFQDVANMFAAFKVSAFSCYAMRSTAVDEYNLGDFNDGYVVNFTENPVTQLRASYPKFKTPHGTYVSFRYGIWNTTTNSYESERLKVINFPVLKSHFDYGVTASVKNYMGVVSQTLTNTHAQIRYGALGTAIAESRFPTLTLLDAIWINANPIEEGSGVGPPTPYQVASHTNVLGASQDLVALEYYASKHILIPAAIAKGYTAYASLDPDYAPVTPGLTESYHNYLEKSMNELQKAGYQVTMNASQMNVRVAPLDAGKPVADAGSDQTVNEDTIITLNGSASGDDGTVLTYTWTFMDATPQSLTGRTPTYTFQTPGIYPITLNVTDAAGNWDIDTTVVSVRDTTKPVADAGHPQTATAGALVNFDASASHDNVGIVSLEWSFGDGTIGTGATATHVYPNPGNYTVTLTVEDAAGNAATHQVTVTVQSAQSIQSAEDPNPLMVLIAAAMAVAGIIAAAILLLRKRK